MPNFYSLEMYADNTMSFCSKERPPPISVPPYSGAIRITYHSGTATGRGYKLTVSASRCPPADLLEPSGAVFLNNEAKECVIRIVAPTNQTITFFIGENSYITPSTDCKEGGLEVLDGLAGSSPRIGRVCEPSMSRGFSSTGPGMLIKYWAKDFNTYSRVDGHYWTTDQGPGCGGALHQDSGVFTSPMYPAPYRNASVCRWDIFSPGARSPVLNFKAFDLGPNTSCDTDFVEVFDVDAEDRETSLARYCGKDKPGFVRGHTHRIAVKYTTSVRNGGTGWMVEFRGLASGDQWHQLDSWKSTTL
ncbi:hypothetical protein FOCC_FOCC015570 [Frankliniella occidentalis]|nr:hypothetical protein FOCC_FOCC015570 [Frankliniella occidentalis]